MPQPISLRDEGRDATREVVARFDRAAPAWGEFAAPDRLETLRGQLATLEAIDRRHGGHGALALEDAGDLVASILAELGRIDSGLRRAGDTADLDAIVLGVALWALRHDVEISVVEPVTNALADRSNRARTREELAAAFGLMQGVIAHVHERLSPDLERSNPERPWRLLHVNLAITAIRTEDPAMIDFAFDALEQALPDERAGFFAEALALGLAPGVKPEVRDRIEKRHLKWTQHS